MSGSRGDESVLKRGDEIVLTADNLSGTGTAVGRAGDVVCFLHDALPGDTVRATITRVKKNHIEGRAVEVLTPSIHRTEARCRHFPVCGGCSWQNLEYGAQLEFKWRRITEVFRRIGGIDDVEVLPVLGCPDQYYFRNKMEFTFSNARWLTPEEIAGGEPVPRELTLGLHPPKHYEKVLDLAECHLQSETSSRILTETREYFRGRELDAYSTRTHRGFLRHLVIREGKRTGQRMVNLVTTESRPEEMKRYVSFLRVKFPTITTIVNNVTTRKSLVAQGESEFVYLGEGTILEEIAGYRFRISANSFFQTNTDQAEVLFNTVRELSDLTASDTVYDLYCGTGTIAICLSDAVERVVGIEANASAVMDAERNAKENRIANCYFLQGDLPGDLDHRSELLRDHPVPTVVVVDPPRMGLHEELVRKVLKLLPEKVVYVSCNAATQARDVKLFLEGGYTPGPVRPVDMFPHTDHVETVMVLRR